MYEGFRSTEISSEQKLKAIVAEPLPANYWIIS